MRSGLALTLGMLMSGAVGCASVSLTTPATPTPGTPTADAGARLAIERVGVEPKTLDVRTPSLATIHYALTQPATTHIDLVDDAGIVVRRLELGPQPAGSHQAQWDGQTDEGSTVSSGVYRYLIVARDQQGTQVIHDPSRETGGDELMPREFTYDRGTGRLSWVMPRAGFARLRMGLEGFPHLRTLLDWEPMEAGRHELVWDGLDASGFIRLAEHPTLSVKLAVYTMPDNTIVVHRNSDSSVVVHASSMPSTYAPLFRPNASYLHARHPRGQCHEARLRVEFPEAARADGDGRPVLTAGAVPVRVTIDKEDARTLVNTRFELALYEDLTILFEEEEATNPFTFVWDTSRLPVGQHLLTVNVLGYDDHFGVATQPVMIEPRS